MKLPTLNIAGLQARLPIIQGGMGIGISLSGLAGAVAREGGVGVISGVQIGYRDPNFAKNPFQANIDAIGEEIAKARDIAQGGILGMNFMYIAGRYQEYVAEAVKQGIDLIISGAGLPMSLPKFVEGSKTRILPIVSSVRACKLVVSSWMKKHDRVPDAVVIEGPKAGGHLGFKMEELLNGTAQTLEQIVQEVCALLRELECKYGLGKIPVIAAGGIRNHEDITQMLALGADGVQIGTAFVATRECDASEAFKNAYVNAAPSDARIVLSPTGLPARAVNTPFVQRVYGAAETKLPVARCYGCLPGICSPDTTKYCLSEALFQSARGEDGLVFCGEAVGDITGITTVGQLMRQLAPEQ